MSEYQYYGFQAIDRPLSEDDRRWLRGLSTRAQITTTSFVNVYHWGNFRGDPIKLMERCFDAFVYVTNWGYRRFMLRLPLASFDAALAKEYCYRDGVSLRNKKDYVLLEFDRDDELGEWEDWDAGSGWMASLTPLRSDLLDGDWRCLYLAWLSGIETESLWDDRGNSYLDLLAGCWCTVLGHGHPRLGDAIREQTARLIHTGPPFPSDEIQQAMAKLAEVVPAALNRAVFLNTGSEAVELALKMVRAATGADVIVTIARSYYGATTYALSLSEAGRDVGWLPRVGTVVRIPAPDCRKCPAGAAWPCGDFPCLDPLRELANKRDRAVAAVIFEPVLANGGVIVPPAGYGSRLRALAAQLKALFIAEEVTTGIGRTGRWFGFEHEDAVPDILVIGKAVGAGLPVAAVVTTEEVEARCEGALTHVQSHQNDPFSGRVAATVISIVQEEGLVERAATLGDYLLKGLRELQSRHAGIADVRGRGLMVGIELNREWSSKGTDIARQLLDAGFIVNYRPHNAAFRLFPP